MAGRRRITFARVLFYFACWSLVIDAINSQALGTKSHRVNRDEAENRPRSGELEEFLNSKDSTYESSEPRRRRSHGFSHRWHHRGPPEPRVSIEDRFAQMAEIGRQLQNDNAEMKSILLGINQDSSHVRAGLDEWWKTSGRRDGTTDNPASATEICRESLQLNNELRASMRDLRSYLVTVSADLNRVEKDIEKVANTISRSQNRNEQALPLKNSNSTTIGAGSTKCPECLLDRTGDLESERNKFPSNCWEVFESGRARSGVYMIRPRADEKSFFVYCQMEDFGGGWTVLQNRRDGKINFYQAWDEYEAGFGDLCGEFWLGLEKIHRLTTSKEYEMLIEVEDFEETKCFAIYDAIEIGSERERYRILNLGHYNGTAGDALSGQIGNNFTTWDTPSDEKSSINAAEVWSGAWWYGTSFANGNLNGMYLRAYKSGHLTKGFSWYAWRGAEYSLKRSRISIRPRGVASREHFEWSALSCYQR